MVRNFTCHIIILCVHTSILPWSKWILSLCDVHCMVCGGKQSLTTHQNQPCAWALGTSWSSQVRKRGKSGWNQSITYIISAPVKTGLVSHPASYTMSTGSFLGVKLPGHGVDHPSPSSTEVKEKLELYIYCPSGPLWPVLWWTLHLPFP